MQLRIYTDGGARGNPGPAAAAFVVKDEQGEVVYQKAYFLGRATNNEAEYQAVIKALSWLKKKKDSLSPSRVDFFLDSRLVVEQINGRFRVKSPHLAQLLSLVEKKKKELSLPVFFSQIPRAQNKEADALLQQKLVGMI